MFRFENPDYLYILIVIPVLVLLYIGLYFQETHQAFGRVCFDWSTDDGYVILAAYH